MDSHKETQVSDLASDKNRKSTYATEVATPGKRMDSKPEDDQASEVQQSDDPTEATLLAEVQGLEKQVVINLKFSITRLELTRYANS